MSKRDGCGVRVRKKQKEMNAETERNSAQLLVGTKNKYQMLWGHNKCMCECEVSIFSMNTKYG